MRSTPRSLLVVRRRLLVVCLRFTLRRAPGGGLTTFGSPMVLFSKQPDELWDGLHALTAAHPHLDSLQFDHVVTIGDMVPRLLGSNLSSLHAALRSQLQVRCRHDDASRVIALPGLAALAAGNAGTCTALPSIRKVSSTGDQAAAQGAWRRTGAGTVGRHPTGGCRGQDA